MKHTIKVLALLVLALTLLCFVVACGGNDTPVTPPDDPSKPSGGGGDEALLDIDTSNVKFNDAQVAYDGLYHKHETYTGNPDPNRANPHFEYYKNGVRVEGDENGVKDVGVYTVKLIFSRSGYRDAVKEATFTITASYNIYYHVGQPTGHEDSEMTVSNANPERFTTGSVELELSTATLDSHKFEGWYLDAACSADKLITVINGADYTADLHLYGKFRPCIDYPSPYVDPTTTPGGVVTEEPATIPAIPGFDRLPADKALVIDMSKLVEDSTDRMGFKYAGAGGKQPWVPTNNAIQTESGEYIIQWSDYNDTLENGERNPDNTPVGGPNASYAGDGTYNAAMFFYTPLKFNYANYDTLEFWIYSANNTVTEEKPDGDIFTLFLLIDGTESRNMSMDIHLNFSGWRKMTISLSDLKALNGSSMNITRVGMLGTQFGGGIPSDNATLADNKDPNFIYFSSIYATNHKTTYNITTSVSESDLMKVLENLGKFTLNATLTDAEIETLLSRFNANATTLSDLLWSDLEFDSTEELRTSYERLFHIAEAWNDPDSTYYRSAEVLDKLAIGMNYMSLGGCSLVNDGFPSDANLEKAGYYVVKITGIISDYINETHARTWMVPVIRYCQSAMGDGEYELQTAYTYACANLAMGNQREFLVGMRAMTSMFSQRKVSLNVGAADVMDAMQLIAATQGTAYLPANNAFINDMFAWFYESIDALLVNGQVPAGLTATYPLDTYLRGMFLLYDLAPARTQNKFAAAVKYYLAQDASLEATLNDAVYLHREAEALTAIKANETAAAAPGEATVIRLWENIGQALYKTADSYFLISRDGTLVTAGYSTDLTAATYTTFRGMIAQDILAILTDDKIIYVSADSVTVKNTDDTDPSFTSGNTTVYVITDTSLKVSDSEAANGTLYQIFNAPAMIAMTKNDNGTISVKVYHYTDTQVQLQIDVKGSYSILETDVIFSRSSSQGGKYSKININLEGEAGARVTTDTVFELTLVPIE